MVDQTTPAIVSSARRRIIAYAAWPRGRFDYLTRTAPPFVFVVALFGLTAFSAWILQALACSRQLPFSFLDLQLSFSARTFEALLRSAGDCRAGVIRTFVTTDLILPLVYAAFLSALYIWVERYLRFSPAPWVAASRQVSSPRVADGPAGASVPFLSSVVLSLPLAAAVVDIVLENLPLYLAARPLARSGGVVTGTAELFVNLGSLGGALKWTTLGLYAIGLVVMLFRGSRGATLWRLRYSVLAVGGGSIALLTVPQGQDVLQRLVEGEHPLVRALLSVLVLAGTAVAVWYSARVLALVRFSRAGQQQRDEWVTFFEQNIPRMLGVAVLALAGAAFARAGGAAPQFLFVVLLSGLVVALVEHRRRKAAKPSNAAAHQRDGASPKKRILFRRLVVSAVIVTVLAALIVWPNSVRPWELGYGDDASDRFALRAAAALASVLAWLLYLFIHRRRDAFKISKGELTSGYSPDRLPAAARRAAMIAVVVSTALFLGFTVAPVRTGRALGPLVVLALTVTNAVFVGSLLSYLGRKTQLPLVSFLLVLAAVFSRWNDNHEIRTLAQASPADSVPPAGDVQSRFRAWLAERAQEDSGEIPVVLVSASGGGLRAAYWTAVALAALQDSTPRFARHVFAISSVSGGSLGAAIFAAMVRDLASRPDTLACVKSLLDVNEQSEQRDSVMARMNPPTSACVRRFMSDDFLAPLLSKLVAPDFLQWFIPVPIRAFDRSSALEGSWERSYEDITRASTLASGFRAFHADQRAKHLPALLLNTTHVQSGRRYIATPFEESAFLDARSVHRALGADLPLSTAVHNSARFSFVSPAGRIERRDGASYGALVDGGYFENSGLATLGDVRREIVAALEAMRADSTLASLASRVRTITVLYLCNDPISCRRDRSLERSLLAKRALAGEWLSPARALLGARNARGSLARSQIERVTNGRFLQMNVCDSLNVRAEGIEAKELRRTRERIVSPPLGWLLSRQARNWMDSSLTAGAPDSITDLTAASRNVGSPCRKANVRALAQILDDLRRSQRAS